MKKIILLCIILFSIFWSNHIYAATGDVTNIKVQVSEKIPWADCTGGNGKYTCNVKPWFSSVQSMIGWIIKWITAIAALSWVLFIVINGILLSTGSEPAEVKKRIIKWITGLILLLLSGVILNMIAPWVYK